MIFIFNHLPSTLKYLLLMFYLAALIYTIVRILLDTHSTPKTLAYLLLIFVFPVIGIILYYSFGINYRHRRIKVKGEAYYKTIIEDFNKNLNDDTETYLKTHHDILGPYFGLIHFIHNLGSEDLNRNMFKLLVNGEEKFPDVLKTLETAKYFIHMEYYAWENDIRGNQIKDILLKKTTEGVKVRILYDAYASRKIKNNIVRELLNSGIEIYPVIKVKIKQLANRINHRDHRKIIIVDGHTGFVGGINISDRYDNSIDTGLYWRDTHVRITGKTVLNLQRHFLINWNVSQSNPLPFSKELFPIIKELTSIEQEGFAQIVAGGPIYPFSNIMLTYFKVFTTAKQKLYITNPYFIPNDTILDALKQAAISGVDVRLMLPAKSDSAIVGAASRFYFRELLQSGVKIFLYNKGFVHAKTVVADGHLSIVGSANMDIRSFDLNFEIMPVIYDKSFATKLEQVYIDDLKECTEVTSREWQKKGNTRLLIYAIARLISSFL